MFIVSTLSQVASVGLPVGARDVWEELGSRAEVRYTWDLTRNTNLEWAGKWKPRCRSVVTCYTDIIYHHPVFYIWSYYLHSVCLWQVRPCLPPTQRQPELRG